MVNRFGRSHCNLNDDILFGADMGVNSSNASFSDQHLDGGEGLARRTVVHPAREDLREFSYQPGQFCSFLTADTLRDLAVVFINAEGKARHDEQVEAIISSVHSRSKGHWLCVAIAEADFLEDTQYFEATFQGHLVFRRYVQDGRAQKFIVNKLFRDYFRRVRWGDRCFSSDFVFASAGERVSVSVTVGHFAHGDAWFDSCDEYFGLVRACKSDTLHFGVGDFNCELRSNFQNESDRIRSDYLLAAAEGSSLKLGFQPVDSLVSRKPAGLSALTVRPSLIDGTFSNPRVATRTVIEWEDAPGDHASVYLFIEDPLSFRRSSPGASVWRCSDLSAFASFAEASIPESFSNEAEFSVWLRSVMLPFTDTRSSAQRRREWEPKRIKDLRRKLRLATDEADRNQLRRQIFSARCQVSKLRQAQKSAAELKAGRFRSKKSSKLFPISSMKIDGQLIDFVEEWLEPIADDFEQRWCQTSDNESQLLAQLGACDDCKFVTNAEEVARACSKVKKPWKLDAKGLCVAAIKHVSAVHGPLANLISSVMSSDLLWTSISQGGVVKGKMRSPVRPSETRGMVPQLSFLQIANQIVLAHMNSKLDDFSELHGLQDVVLGMGKGGQTRDVTFFMSQVLEKARDDFNNGALAIADIRKCHDELPWASAFQGALRRGISKDDASAFLRLHRLPRIHFNILGSSTRFLQRSRGALTGSSSASAMARIIVEDSLLIARPLFSNRFACLGHVFESVCWSDNLICTGSSICSAASNMRAWQSVLQEFMNMDLKPDSFVIVPARTRKSGNKEVILNGCRWEVVDGVRCLGSWISGTGEDGTECRFLANCWSRMFWAHARVLTNRLASIQSRIRFWRSLVYGVSDHRFVGIRPAKSSLDTLEAASNKLLRFIVGVRPLLDEPQEAFCRRRNRSITAAKNSCNFGIQTRFCWKVITWVEHLWRHKSCSNYTLLQLHDDLWLRTMRALSDPSYSRGSIERGATRSRSGPGVPLRWASGWLEELGSAGGGWDNPNKCKATTQSRVDLLIAWLRTRRTFT